MSMIAPPEEVWCESGSSTFTLGLAILFFMTKSTALLYSLTGYTTSLDVISSYKWITQEITCNCDHLKWNASVISNQSVLYLLLSSLTESTLLLLTIVFGAYWCKGDENTQHFYNVTVLDMRNRLGVVCYSVTWPTSTNFDDGDKGS